MKPLLIKTFIYPDNRGFFKELFLKKKLNLIVNLQLCPHQKKMSYEDSIIKVKKNEAKILSVLKGSAIDVCVDIDKKSKNFGKVYKFILKPGLLLYVPKNFAHGIGFFGRENILKLPLV